MPHFLEKYLTEYDDNLSSDSYIDPIGTLIIWSAFGRQVFKNRINSISNDVRNYTLNLFHHFLIRRLINDDNVRLSPALQKQYNSKHSLNFKHACLIFLENIFVYSILQHEKMAGVETTGILGISNARGRWNSDSGKPKILFTHEPVGQILVRQLSLGVSGRYKTPLMDMGFFDKAYQYHNPISQPQWNDAAILITGLPRSGIGKLERIAYDFLVERISGSGARGQIQFGKNCEALSKAYARAFSSPTVVGSYSRDFWLRQTGLNDNAAGALFAILEKSDKNAPVQEVMETALLSKIDPAEKAKLQHIVALEPFLCDVALLFNLMAAERTHTVTSVVAEWQQFGRNDARLPELARQTSQHAHLPAVKGTEAGRRLIELHKVANAGSLKNQVYALELYHRNVMSSRGQPSWLSIENNGTIKTHARTQTRPSPQNWLPGVWNNQYYLPEFSNFVKGLRGVEV